MGASFGGPNGDHIWVAVLNGDNIWVTILIRDEDTWMAVLSGVGIFGCHR